MTKTTLSFSEISVSNTERSVKSLQSRACFHGNTRAFKQHVFWETIDFFEMAHVPKKFPFVYIMDIRDEPTDTGEFEKKN